QNGPHHGLGFGESGRLARQQAADLIAFEYADHSTILLSGYSTIPSPPARFKRGIMSRTVVSSRMVLTASHSSSLRCEMVGRLRAGSTASTAVKLSLWTLSMSPTLPSALMAPSSSMRISSSLRRFLRSSHDVLLAINWVFDSMTVSMILRLLARRLEPVSVTSTMASASTGGLTSVAPQLNSTLALTPCFSR